MLEINLLSWRAAQQNRERKQVAMLFLSAVILALLLTAIANIILAHQLSATQKQLNLVKDELAELELQSKAAGEETPETHLSLLWRRIHSNQRELLRSLKQISVLIPQKSYLVGIYREGREIILTGRTQNPIDAVQFAERFHAANAIAQAKVSAIKRLAQSNLVSFRIQLSNVQPKSV